MRQACFSSPLVALVLVASAAFASGCSSSSGGAASDGPRDAKAFCDKARSCGQPTQNCDAVMAAVRVSQACVDGLAAASCADLTSSSSSAASTCFPPCSGETTTCNGDGTATKCSDGRTLVLDCAASCSLNGKTYTGTCGPAYGAQKSADGQPVCWCQ